MDFKTDGVDEWSSECSSCDSNGEDNMLLFGLNSRAAQLLMAKRLQASQIRATSSGHGSSSGLASPTGSFFGGSPLSLPASRQRGEDQPGGASVPQTPASVVRGSVSFGPTLPPSLQASPRALAAPDPEPDLQRTQSAGDFTGLTAAELDDLREAERKEILAFNIYNVLKRGRKSQVDEWRKMQDSTRAKCVELPPVRRPKVAAKQTSLHRSIGLMASLWAVTFGVKLKRLLRHKTMHQRVVDHEKLVESRRQTKNRVLDAETHHGMTQRSMNLYVQRQRASLQKSLHEAVRESMLRMQHARLKGTSTSPAASPRAGVGDGSGCSAGLGAGMSPSGSVRGAAAASVKSGSGAALAFDVLDMTLDGGLVDPRAAAASHHAPAIPTLDPIAASLNASPKEGHLGVSPPFSTKRSVGNGGLPIAIVNTSPRDATLSTYLFDESGGTPQGGQSVTGTHNNDSSDTTPRNERPSRSRGSSRHQQHRNRMSPVSLNQTRHSGTSPSLPSLHFSHRQSKGGLQHRVSVDELEDMKDNNIFIFNPQWRDDEYVPLEDRNLSLDRYTKQAAPSALYEFTRTKIPNGTFDPNSPSRVRDGGRRSASPPGTPQTARNPDLRDDAMRRATESRQPQTARKPHPPSDGSPLAASVMTAVAPVSSSTFHFGRWRREHNAAVDERAKATLASLPDHRFSTSVGSNGVTGDVAREQLLDIHRRAKALAEADFDEADSAVNTFDKFIIHKGMEHSAFIERSLAEEQRLIRSKRAMVFPWKREAMLQLSDSGKSYFHSLAAAEDAIAEKMERFHLEQNMAYNAQWMEALERRIRQHVSEPTAGVLKVLQVFREYFANENANRGQLAMLTRRVATATAAPPEIAATAATATTQRNGGSPTAQLTTESRSARKAKTTPSRQQLRRGSEAPSESYAPSVPRLSVDGSVCSGTSPTVPRASRQRETGSEGSASGLRAPALTAHPPPPRSRSPSVVAIQQQEVDSGASSQEYPTPSECIARTDWRSFASLEAVFVHIVRHCFTVDEVSDLNVQFTLLRMLPAFKGASEATLEKVLAKRGSMLLVVGKPFVDEQHDLQLKAPLERRRHANLQRVQAIEKTYQQYTSRLDPRAAKVFAQKEASVRREREEERRRAERIKHMGSALRGFVANGASSSSTAGLQRRKSQASLLARLTQQVKHEAQNHADSAAVVTASSLATPLRPSNTAAACLPALDAGATTSSSAAHSPLVPMPQSRSMASRQAFATFLPPLGDGRSKMLDIPGATNVGRSPSLNTSVVESPLLGRMKSGSVASAREVRFQGV